MLIRNELETVAVNLTNWVACFFPPLFCRYLHQCYYKLNQSINKYYNSDTKITLIYINTVRITRVTASN